MVRYRTEHPQLQATSTRSCVGLVPSSAPKEGHWITRSQAVKKISLGNFARGLVGGCFAPGETTNSGEIANTLTGETKVKTGPEQAWYCILQVGLVIWLLNLLY